MTTPALSSSLHHIMYDMSQVCLSGSYKGQRASGLMISATLSGWHIFCCWSLKMKNFWISVCAGPCWCGRLRETLWSLRTVSSHASGPGRGYGGTGPRCPSDTLGTGLCGRLRRPGSALSFQSPLS